MEPFPRLIEMNNPRSDFCSVRQPVRLNFPAMLLFETEPKLPLMFFNLFFLWLYIGSEPPRTTQRFWMLVHSRDWWQREREVLEEFRDGEGGENLGFPCRYFQKIVYNDEENRRPQKWNIARFGATGAASGNKCCASYNCYKYWHIQYSLMRKYAKIKKKMA